MQEDLKKVSPDNSGSKNTIYNMDCIEGMKLIPDNSIDSIVTDPPYEIGFMGKGWDSTGIANNIDMWRECFRVLKPGGHLLSFAATRTYHRMTCAIEDAGFEVRDMIEWVYGSGFPKSRNIGLDVDKRNGVTKNRGKAFVVAGQSCQRDKDTGGDLVPGSNTMGAYVAQNEWSGWGTALKPAHEPICMARKPLAEKTVAENVLKYGTGGINIDESRVEAQKGDKFGGGGLNSPVNGFMGNTENTYKKGTGFRDDTALGRFPANLIHDNSEEVRECFPETTTNGVKTPFTGGASKKINLGGGNVKPYETNSGNASRFFKSIIYQAKASKSERCNGNNHPTVKPIALMEYLIKMVTKEGGIVLDPFMGSGTTAIACLNTNRKYIGFELDENYWNIANKRIQDRLSEK